MTNSPCRSPPCPSIHLRPLLLLGQSHRTPAACPPGAPSASAAGVRRLVLDSERVRLSPLASRGRVQLGPASARPGMPARRRTWGGRRVASVDCSLSDSPGRQADSVRRRPSVRLSAHRAIPAPPPPPPRARPVRSLISRFGLERSLSVADGHWLSLGFTAVHLSVCGRRGAWLV